MDPAEVLAVEIKQYVGQGLQSLVPRVIGQTAEAEKKKSTGGREPSQWNEQTFFAECERRNGPQITQIARHLYEWARTKTDRFYWGKGSRDGSVYPILDDARGKQRLFCLFTSGKMQIPFDSMRNSLPFSAAEKRSEWLGRLNEIDGINLPPNSIDTWPQIELSNLQNPQALAELIAAMNWAVEQILA